MQPQPRMVVVAGPSGSGKSTHFPIRDIGIAFFNVDDRCAELNNGSYLAIPRHVRVQAQRECEEFVSASILASSSFAVETTLRSRAALDQAIAAKAAGFRLEMIYVATDDVAENVVRVKRRALRGGHSAPELQLREIYARSLEHLREAVALFDEVLLHDSTKFNASPQLVATFSSGGLVYRRESLPRWCVGALGEAVSLY
jgi:predicted ABC-type ATPase